MTNDLERQRKLLERLQRLRETKGIHIQWYNSLGGLDVTYLQTVHINDLIEAMELLVERDEAWLKPPPLFMDISGFIDTSGGMKVSEDGEKLPPHPFSADIRLDTWDKVIAYYEPIIGIKREQSK